MVLLLESRHLKDSKWTQHEIDFAKRHRLGLYTLRMPDVDDDEALKSVRIGAFMKLDESKDFDSSPRTMVDEKGKQIKEWPN